MSTPGVMQTWRQSSDLSGSGSQHWLSFCGCVKNDILVVNLSVMDVGVSVCQSESLVVLY